MSMDMFGEIRYEYPLPYSGYRVLPDDSGSSGLA